MLLMYINKNINHATSGKFDSVIWQPLNSSNKRSNQMKMTYQKQIQYDFEPR